MLSRRRTRPGSRRPRRRLRAGRTCRLRGRRRLGRGALSVLRRRPRGPPEVHRLRADAGRRGRHGSRRAAMVGDRGDEGQLRLGQQRPGPHPARARRARAARHRLRDARRRTRRMRSTPRPTTRRPSTPGPTSSRRRPPATEATVSSGRASPRPIPKSRPQPIREWEIWNEPNSSTFWAPTPDPAAYADLLTRSAKIIDEGDPEAQVMSAGMFATPAVRRRDRLLRLPRSSMFDQSGVADAVDVVGVHPYGPDVEVGDRSGDEDARRRSTMPAATRRCGRRRSAGARTRRAETTSRRRRRSRRTCSAPASASSATRSDDLGLDGVVWYTWHDSTESSVGRLRLVRDRRAGRRRSRQQAGLDRLHRSDRRDALSGRSAARRRPSPAGSRACRRRRPRCRARRARARPRR